MKTKLIATILLAVIGLLLVVGGTSNAQPLDNHQPIYQPTISNTVYLPVIAKPPCTYTPPMAYVSVNKPVVRAGEIVTVTGALMNDCAILEHPEDYLDANPEGLLYPSHAITNVYPQSIGPGSYQAFTFTVQGVGTGEVTITVSSSYETAPIGTSLYNWWWGRSVSRPVVVRILP